MHVDGARSAGAGPAGVAVQRAHFDRVWQAPVLEVPDYIPRDPRRALLGPLTGLRVLDLGCGRGEWSLFLAQQGARVIAADLSLEGTRLVVGSAAAHGLPAVRGLVGDAHSLPFRDGCFDVIHGQFILHHLELGRAGPELARVLRPGGVAVFVENSANNALLMIARPLCGHFGIPKWSVEGEYPLRHVDVARLRALFGAAETHYFEFQFFKVADDKLFGGRRILGWLDALVYRFLPALRPYGYTQWLKFSKPRQSVPA